MQGCFALLIAMVYGMQTIWTKFVFVFLNVGVPLTMAQECRGSGKVAPGE